MSAIATGERLQMPTTPVPSAIRSVAWDAAAMGTNASPKVISGTHAWRKPRSSAARAKSTTRPVGRPVRKRPRPLSVAIARA